MKYFVFVLPLHGRGGEAWHVHPITRREFSSSHHPGQDLYGLEHLKEAEELVDMLSRQNPGCRVVLSKPEKVGQTPMSVGEVSYTTINEKGMLPL